MIIVLFNVTYTKSSSRTVKVLSITINYAHIIPRIILSQGWHASSMKFLLSLMKSLINEIHKYPPSHTSINAMRKLSGMGYWVSYPLQTLSTNRRSCIFFSVSFNSPWTMWNATMLRAFRRVLRKKTWCGQEYTWGSLCKMILFRRYWH